jgi:hypothetical protein
MNFRIVIDKYGVVLKNNSYDLLKNMTKLGNNISKHVFAQQKCILTNIISLIVYNWLYWLNRNIYFN